jgi:hypothetical protein
METYEYTAGGMTDLIEQLEHAIDEMDSALRLLSSLPTHRKIEARLCIAADTVQVVRERLEEV